MTSFRWGRTNRKAARMISATGKNRAFSLIELMVTVVIVSVGLIFVLRAYGYCAQHIANAQNHVRGAWIMEDLLRELRGQVLKAEDGAFSSGSGKVTLDDREFKWTKEVSDWHVPSEGSLSNLAPSESEDETLQNPAMEHKAIAQIQFNVTWKARGKTNEMSVRTVMIREEDGE